MSKNTSKNTNKSKISTATIIDCGILSDTLFPGRVSAIKMVENQETTRDCLDKAAKSLNDYYVAVNHSARTRCIDGRHDPDLDEKNLGPQVPGGAPGAALAYRLAVDKDDLTRGTFLADAETMIGYYTRLGLAFGGHRDENSVGESTVGCGAIDAMDVILSKMTEPTLVDEQKRIVKILLGTDFDRDLFLRDMGAAVLVNGRSDDYFRGREQIIDILEERSHKSIATLKGDHRECLVVVNLVPDTTLSSNKFSEAFGGIQAFGYDLWRSKQIAQSILPLPEQAHDRQSFIIARVMTTVATLVALTDGSQRLLLRVPEVS